MHSHPPEQGGVSDAVARVAHDSVSGYGRFADGVGRLCVKLHTWCIEVKLKSLASGCGVVWHRGYSNPDQVFLQGTRAREDAVYCRELLVLCLYPSVLR